MNQIRTWAAGLLLATWGAAAAASQPYRIEAAPAWVKEAADAPLIAPGEPVEAGQSDFLLVDHQVRLAETTSHYQRFAERLVSQASVDQAAQISIDVDPEREVILLHKVHVFRDGLAIDKLASARRRVLSRESELEHGVINGRVTLHLLLQDVRVGDVLDYSWSIVRTDPPNERQYFDWFSTQWTSPARHFRLRVVRPPDRVLHVMDRSGLAKPKETREGEWLDTSWEGFDIAALPDEAARPHWHMRYPRIELSEFGTWNEVRDWALPRYVIPAQHGAVLDGLLTELRAMPDGDARILRALRFVQDDIRYTGLEIGSGAWTPSPPARVMARRYGDCKDKVLLLVALLRDLGVEAYPALVHSEMRRAVRERLPNPAAFDHAIAKVRWKGQDYWLDATVSGQGGSLDSLVQADFGPALVLSPDADGLEDMPEREGRTPSSFVVETYDFRKGTAHTAAFSVRTLYREEDADGMRVKMRTETAAELGKDYLDYYRKSYHGVRMLRPPKITDDRTRNQFEVEESYEIDKPFETTAKGPKFYLEAYLITDRTRKPDETLRTTPLSRRFPMHVHHEVVAYLPGEWNISDDVVNVDDQAFTYFSSTHFRDGKLDLVYDLRNNRDYVPVGDLDDFLVKLDKVHDDAFFTLTEARAQKARKLALTLPAPGATGAKPARDGPSIVFVIAALMGLGLGGWLAWHFWKLDRPPRPAQDFAPEGLGGWMVLPVLQAISGPPSLIYVATEWVKAFGSDAVFRDLAIPLQYLVFGYALLVAFAFVPSIMQLVLMFTRRNSFPRLFIALKAGYFAMAALAFTVTVVVGAPAKTVDVQIATLLMSAFSCTLWIAYMRVSQRVRITFTRRPDSGEDYRVTRVPKVLGSGSPA